MKQILLCLFIMMSVLCVDGQVVDRQRPAEWDSLICGGRFMDRLLPMSGKTLDYGAWGADSVRLRYVDNGIEVDGLSIWGGNILSASDGKYHLYVCGWHEDSPEGHMFWPHSTVYHAVSDELDGPYTICDTIGKGHNPEAFRLDDGRIVIYVIDGYYISDSEYGPWQRSQFDFDPRDRNIIEGLSNLTFTRRPDGSRLMVCRGGGVWISRTGLSPYMQLTDRRVYPDVDGCFEDPVVWRDSLQYHLIVNDWLGRIAYYLRSKDGVNWVTEQGEAYMPGIAVHADGLEENWFKYERPKVYQDSYGRVVQMNFAVIDTIKWEDKPCDKHSSKNICLPVNPGLRLSVLNTKPIDALTKRIEVLVKSEEGFDPEKDIDFESLRFGSYNEVNFGRGARAVDSRKSGDDLIVVFDGEGSGIDAAEFAPKLIGRDRSGKMLYGYASLPYVDYKPALLSARKPGYDAATGMLSVIVENYGLSDSKPTTAVIECDGKVIARVPVPAIKPYGLLQLSGKGLFKPDDSAVFKVKFSL